MHKHCRWISSLIVAFLLMTMPLIAAEEKPRGAVESNAPLRSGCQVGELVPTFYSRAVTGPLMNKSVCYICRNGERPVVMVLLNGGVGPEVEPLLKSIDRLVDRNRASGLRGFGVLLSSEPLRDASRVQTFAFDAKIAMPLTVATEAVAGPSCQRVHPDAAVTVIVYEKRRVEANFSYRAGELDGDAVREIVDRVAHLAGGNKAD
jgi:hypothetical protein